MNHSKESFRGRLKAMEEAGDDLPTLRKLLNDEIKGANRPRFVLRIYGRFSLVRRKLEEAAIAAGTPLK